MSNTKLVVGLGNPGTKYAHSFHNMGFLAVERLCVSMGLKFKTIECKAVTASTYINGNRVVIAKPQTYMNLSGDSVRELLGKYNVELENMLVIYDDIDIPRGAVRVRKSGSGGTHNGMRSVLACVSGDTFPRVRLGIGAPPPEIPLGDYVLMTIPKQWHAEFDASLNSAVSASTDFLHNVPLDQIMQAYNKV